MIKSDLGAEIDVLKEIREIPEVRKAYTIYGVYDLIIRVETGTSDDLKELIQQKLRIIQNVQSTLTMVIIDADPARKHECELISKKS